MEIYHGLSEVEKVKHLVGVVNWLRARDRYKREQNTLNKKVKKGILRVVENDEKETSSATSLETKGIDAGNYQ
jgi:hypothetical protein